MYIHYKNSIYIYDNTETDYEKCTLISKLRYHIHKDLKEIQSIVNIYLNIKRLNCRYDIKIEEYANNIVNSVLS